MPSALGVHLGSLWYASRPDVLTARKFACLPRWHILWVACDPKCPESMSVGKRKDQYATACRITVSPVFFVNLIANMAAPTDQRARFPDSQSDAPDFACLTCMAHLKFITGHVFFDRVCRMLRKEHQP